MIDKRREFFIGFAVGMTVIGILAALMLVFFWIAL